MQRSCNCPIFGFEALSSGTERGRRMKKGFLSGKKGGGIFKEDETKEKKEEKKERSALIALALHSHSLPLPLPAFKKHDQLCL